MERLRSGRDAPPVLCFPTSGVAEAGRGVDSGAPPKKSRPRRESAGFGDCWVADEDRGGWAAADEGFEAGDGAKSSSSNRLTGFFGGGRFFGGG